MTRPLSIDVALRAGRSWRGAALLRRAAAVALRAEGIRSGRLSIAVVGDAEMAALHRRHLGVSGPTDVLTFDYGGGSADGVVDGEIVVCAAVALRRVSQSEPPSHSRPGAARRVRATRAVGGVVRDARIELALYVVHGVLHLAGYDDQNRREAQIMHAREDEIMSSLGHGAAFSKWSQ